MSPIVRFAPLLLLSLAACSTVEVQPQATTQAPVEVKHDAFAEAHALATAAQPDARRIDALLASIDDTELARRTAALAEGDALYPHAGRALMRRGLPLPRTFARGWRFDGRPAGEADGYRPPLKVALLLPSSAAGNSVRDGFMTGYYEERRRKPEVRVYDTAGGAASAYERAVVDGNDYVVGPLGRDEVDGVFARGELPVPVLALNRGDRSPPEGSVGFSLSPEDEGISAAEYLLQRRIGNVLLLVGSEDSLRRTAASLTERLQQRGGKVVQRIDVTDAKADISAQLQAAQAAGAQAIFLALRTAQARELGGQLQQLGLGLPRIGTTPLSADDSANPIGVAYPTEAWGTRDIPGLPARSVVEARLRTARGPAGRLFAFGYDAWLLTGYLEKLATAANAELPGATGKLRLDGFGNIVREPVWISRDLPVAPASSGGR